MRSADDTKTNLDAPVTASDDGASASSILASGDVAKIAQTSYELYGLDKTGMESDLNRNIKFRLSPTIDAGQQIPGAAGSSFTLTGKNLHGVLSIVMYDSADQAKKAEISVLATTDASLTASVPAGLATGTYAIRLLLDDGAGTVFDFAPPVTVTH